jgi:hypothetical protein
LIEFYAVFPPLGNGFEPLGPKAYGHVPCSNSSMGFHASLESELKILREAFVKKLALLFATLWAVGAAGFVCAQEPSVTAVEENHPMIFELGDRIQNQRIRIALGLDNNTLTADEAASCTKVLDSVEGQLKADYKTNGSQKAMKLKRDQYFALNALLDSNSVVIHEEKQNFYSYDPYFNGYGGYYDYYYGDYPAADQSAFRVSSTEENHPMIFELRDRIANQRDRIDEGLYNNTLTGGQVSACRKVLTSVEKKMKADYKSNGSNDKKMRLTKEQYLAFNTTLDSNSTVIHEEKQSFYYYGPYYDSYWYWN